jgi:protein SCO1
MKSKYKNILAAGIIGVAFILFVIFIYLPYAAKQDKVNIVTETLHHSTLLKDPVKQIPAFSFINQNGKIISNKDVNGKVYVADFFYTSCEAVCPMMNSQLTGIQKAINKSAPFRILSFSLDPENDSVPVLKSFAQKFEAIDSIWFLMTGPKEQIYALGKDGFMQSVLNDSASFINHSQKFILVDKAGWIRGFYNGLDSLEIQALIEDINYLAYKKDEKE